MFHIIFEILNILLYYKDFTHTHIYVYIYINFRFSFYILLLLLVIWPTVEIYYLRQVCHQVSESPIVLQAFLFLHIMTIIYLCLSIVLKRVHLDPHPWRSLLARVGAHLCFCPCLSGPPSRCLGGLFNQQVFWKENGFWHDLATHSC